MNSETPLPTIPRCSYEGSSYQREFWTDQRAYEDQAERFALRQLLPPRGQRLVEIGAGAGRLGDLYLGYDEIYLVDYAKTQLAQARERWGHDPRFTFVQGDIYSLPFPANYFDTVVTVRVLHHVKEVSVAFGEIARILAPRGAYVTEYANKRNAKALLRYLLGQAKAGENPLSIEPFEFVALNIDYHPRHIQSALEQAGFVTMTELGASFFRIPLLKRFVPPALLARLDALLQRPAAPLRLTPSIFLQSYIPKKDTPPAQPWRCPACKSDNIMSSQEQHQCDSCGRSYPIQNGIHLFRAGEE